LINDHGRNQVRLIGLQPIHSLTPAHRDRFEAYAQAPYLQRFDWQLVVYAICANSSALSRYEIVYHFEDPSSATFKTTAAHCPSGTVAFGAGAGLISDPPGSPSPGRVGLQLVRTSGPLDITRAAGRADSGYTGRWGLYAAAVCARPVGGIHAVGVVEAGPTAVAYCPSGYRVHGAGGGGGLKDGGPVWLREIYPSISLNYVSVRMTGLLHPSIGGMVAHITCAR
jgi:hypothetical protein